MEQEQERPKKYMVVPVHTPSLTHALSIAMARGIMVWREAEEGTPFSAYELFEFAKRQDEEHPLEEPRFYMVTRDGAIGISPGLEWMTRWMFVPMEDCKERDFMLLKMREDLERDRAVRAAVEKAVTEGLAKEKAAKEKGIKEQAVPVGDGSPVSTPVEAPQPAPSAPKALKFCPNCGAKVMPGNKFCTHCGKSVIIN